MVQSLSVSSAKKRTKRSEPRPVNSRLEIKGAYEGDLSGKDIMIHRNATVMGNLGARSVVIHGQVNGVIQAATIALGKTARIYGELRYARLSVDQGAEVEARLIPDLPVTSKRRSARRRVS